jgi:hypothetical protein
MKDLMFILPYRAGTLAQLTEAISQAGVNLQGCSGQQFGPEGIIHVLVDDAASAGARQAAEQAGFAVRGERDVLVAPIEDRPGGLASLLTPLAAAGVNADLLYLATGSRVVIGVEDLERAQAALRPAGR